MPVVQDNEEPPLEAVGVLMTYIDCPSCGETFDMEGDCDADRVDCPLCDVALVVKRG